MMRTIMLLTLAGAALLITGCGDLLSLHALYTDKDDVLDRALEGRWETKDDVVDLQRAAFGYILTIASKEDRSDSSKFEVHLVNIAGVRFADFLPMDGVGHMFARVRVTEGQLRIAFFDSQWLRQRVPYEEADLSGGKKQAMLTAHTPELRRMVEKYALEPKAYDDEISFHR